MVVRAVRQAYDRERRKIAERHLTRERWLKAGRPKPVPVQLPCMIFADRSATSLEIGQCFGFSAEFHEGSVDYLDRQGERAFSDYGVLFIVHDISACAVEAALVLASSRSTGEALLTIQGPANFLSLCIDIAAKRKIALQTSDGVLLIQPARDYGSKTKPVHLEPETRPRQQDARTRFLQHGVAPTAGFVEPKQEMPTLREPFEGAPDLDARRDGTSTTEEALLEWQLLKEKERSRGR